MISAFVKTVKPNPVIYRLFTEEFALKENECVFIDDSTPNAEAANRLGLDTVVFHGDPARLRADLRKRGVNVRP